MLTVLGITFDPVLFAGGCLCVAVVVASFLASKYAIHNL